MSFTGQGLANTLAGSAAPGGCSCFLTAAAEALPAHIDRLREDFAASSQLYQVFLYLQIESPHQKLSPVLAEHRQIWLTPSGTIGMGPSQSQLSAARVECFRLGSQDEFDLKDGSS